MAIPMKSLMFMILTLGVMGCAMPTHPRTPFLRSVDLVDMTNNLSESFAHDEIINSRTSDDSPWVISLNDVVNNTQQIIPESERWLYVARLRSRLAQSDCSARHNMIWVVPPEGIQRIDDENTGSSSLAEQRLTPTHLLTGEFVALTNTSHTGRSDTYVCDYQLVDLQSGLIVWEDAWEVKRYASGLTYD